MLPFAEKNNFLGGGIVILQSTSLNCLIKRYGSQIKVKQYSQWRAPHN